MTRAAAQSIYEQVFDTPGFTLDLGLTPPELAAFRGAIEAHWIDTLRHAAPGAADRFAEAGIAQYHTLSHLVDHARLWPKERRILPQAAVEELKSLPFLDRLRTAFGAFSIGPVVHGNTVDSSQQEIYWRLVRPDAASDVGPLHADRWFHAVLRNGAGICDPGLTTVKIWIAIHCEPGRNGLIVVPDSHRRDWRHSYVERSGELKPQFDEEPAAVAGTLIETAPGDTIVFNERLLHGGAVNRGSTTRVSAEITILVAPRS